MSLDTIKKQYSLYTHLSTYKRYTPMVLSIVLFLSCGNEQVAEYEAKIDSMSINILILDDSIQNEQFNKMTPTNSARTVKINCVSTLS